MRFTVADLKYAWELVRRGSRSAGIDGITVDLFSGVKEEQLLILQSQLERESYKPSPARGFYLQKHNGGKRLLGIPTVRDRVVQRYLLEELYLPLEEEFADCSYAYRPGRGIQTAVKHLHFYYQYQPTWIIKSDIENFFDNLCWALLLAAVERLHLDSVVVQLVKQQLESGIVVKGRRLNPKQGVLQGAVLSGALANLYLNEFDRACLRHDINLVRYGDDFAIACNSLAAAERTLDQIETWLANIYLKLQPQKTQIVSPEREFSFLGYQFQQGQVFAPPPVLPNAGNLPLTPSGTPARPRAICIHSFLSQPPKTCTLSTVSKTTPAVASNPHHFFIESMTTLYITEQGSYLKAQNSQFRVFQGGELRCQIPVNRVSHVVLFGCCNVSHGAVRLALSRRIPVMYLSQRGRYFGRLETEGQAKVNYLAQQVRRAEEPEFCRAQAEAIVRAKLHNSRVLLMRLNRRRRSEKAKQAIENIAQLMNDLPLAESMDALRGYEGKAATVYFQGLGSFFEETFSFERRTKRPPTDPINSLLSLGYTLLSQNVHSFVEAIGLHTHFGNLHVPRDNHPALVSDLVEEFRARAVDSLVAYLVNRKIFTPEDFTPADERGGVYLHVDALKKFLKHWEEKLLEEMTHPYTGYKVSLRRCLELQVREYVSCVMGDTDGYRPMFWEA
ncbi:CRISPR-associated endonuclease Cas1 [Oscillatoria sp. FACHB-1406]|uniref:CRISPR-associated endonuclease Cas1 n=1 Tax=Oscillatoria sp. FACHB-1406 TaxID=2692846 RepID=UPI001684F9B5|nr:CRISPR-associated endonuclease Cas1 [Oscillatoria sp. FACHB-1406]MBD2580132.1 CRISPR-associated endonuclease Cas1 [Oscillatoria sp. FACHB-1406]